MFTPNNALLSQRHRFSTTPVIGLTDQQLKVRDEVARQIDNGIYKLEPRSCCICGSRDGELVSERGRYGLLNSTQLCKVCGLLRTEPAFRQQDYEDFYSHSYRHLYMGEKYATDAFFEEQISGGQRILAFLSGFISLPESSLILDVGCGAGGMVQTFVDNGYRGIGVDYDSNYLEKGQDRDLDLREGTISNLRNMEKPKLIVCSHVLEHVHDPNAELQLIRETLHDDGYLYIELPGIKGELRGLYRADLLRFLHIAHLYHFTLTTLTNLLHRNGFTLVRGNENIQSVWQKNKVRTDFDSDYRSIKTYLVRTEQFRHPLALRAGSAFRIRQVLNFLLKRLGLYGLARKIYRKVKRI